MSKFESLLEKLRDAGISCVSMWEEAGPKRTNIDRHGVILLNNHIMVYYQIYTGNNGFDYYIQSKLNVLDECERELHFAAMPK